MNKSVAGSDILTFIQRQNIVELQRLYAAGWNIYAGIHLTYGKPLQVAVRLGKVQVANWLIAMYHADGKKGHRDLESAANTFLKMPFHAFRELRWKPTFKNLVQGMRGEYLNFLLQYHDSRHYAWILQALLDAGADPYVRDANNDTLLQKPADASCVLMLLEWGLNVNVRGHDGFTCLHYHCLDSLDDRNTQAVIATLLIFGADPNIVNDLGQSADDHLKCYAPAHGCFLQKMQVKIEDARARVQERWLCFCKIQHERFGQDAAYKLPPELIELCVRPSARGQRRLILEELGYLHPSTGCVKMVCGNVTR
jgi:hypothetical protein